MSYDVSGDVSLLFILLEYYQQKVRRSRLGFYKLFLHLYVQDMLQSSYMYATTVQVRRTSDYGIPLRLLHSPLCQCLQYLPFTFTRL